MELASLYLHMDRRPDAKGNVPDVPAANVIKSRLADHRFEDGELKWIDLLPPRLPFATPKAIREYIKTPPDYGKLKPAERLIEDKETEADIASMKLATAEAERETEALRIERMNRADQSAKGVVRPASTQAAPISTPTNRTPNAAGVVMVTDAQLAAIKTLKQECKIDAETWTTKILSKRNVTSAKELSESQAKELIDALQRKRIQVVHTEEMKQLEQNAAKK